MPFGDPDAAAYAVTWLGMMIACIGLVGVGIVGIVKAARIFNALVQMERFKND